jgi:hypothetical protein
MSAKSPNLATAIQQCANEMMADEAATAGDEVSIFAVLGVSQGGD